MATLKRYDIKKLLAKPNLRRRLIVESTRVTQAREDIVVSEAQVENSYYVVTEGERAAFFGLASFRTDGGEFDGRHIEFTRTLSDFASLPRCDVTLRDFATIDGAPLTYSRLSLIGILFRDNPPLFPAYGETKIGHQTFNDERFVRHWWEVKAAQVGANRKWVPFAKGGSFSRFYSDVYLVVRWDNDAHVAYSERKSNFNVLLTSSASEYLHKEALTWPRRTNKGFNIRRMPPGCIFGDKGPALFPKQGVNPWFLAGVLNSGLAEFIMGSLTSYSWESGVIQKVPIPKTSRDHLIVDISQQLHDHKSIWDAGNEICTHFDRPWVIMSTANGDIRNLLGALDHVLVSEATIDAKLTEFYTKLNDAVYRLYGVNDIVRAKIEAAIGERPPEVVWPQMEGKSTDQKRLEHVWRLLSYAVKCVVEEDNDGLVSLQSVAQEQPLLERVRTKLASFFPEQDPHTLEIEIVNELKKRVKGYGRSESLHDWLTHCCFDFHCNLYQQRPILWHLSSSQDSAEPAFSVIVHYHRFDHDLLAKLRSVHVRDRMTTLRREAAQAGKDNREDDRLQLLAALEEVEALDKKLAKLQEGHHNGAESGDDDYRILTPWKKPSERSKGWQPEIDDGVKVNIAPLARTGLLRNKNKFGAKEAED